jgi:alpha-tubulin suppressor-like RCC1 family protein
MKKLYLLLVLILSLSVKSQVIAAGYGFSFFLCESGIPMASGLNFNGGLGIGYADSFSHPVPSSVVGNISNIVSISAGAYHTLFLDNQGRAWGCGQNGFGQLGDGTTQDRPTPILITGISNVVAIAAGLRHSLFLKNDGTVWSTGLNSEGELGYVIGTDREIVPTQIPTLSGIIAIATGSYHSVFLKNDGTVWVCGWNSLGQLGTGQTIGRYVPYHASITNVIGIAAGVQHTLFLKDDGTVWATGDNYYGQLGDGTTTDRRTPLAINSLTGITKIYSNCSSDGSYFIKNDGTSWACGVNFGSIENSATHTSTLPISVGPAGYIKEIGVGNYHALFVKNDGTLWGAGNNASGELGISNVGSIGIPQQLTNICNLNLQTSIFNSSENFIYPNPAKNILNLKSNNVFFHCSIYDIQGRIIESFSEDKKIIDVSALIKGMYFIEFRNIQNQVYREKFVKE